MQNLKSYVFLLLFQFSSFLLVLIYRKGIISHYSAFSFRMFHTDEIVLSLDLNIYF